jgi:dihydrofolate reductase
MSSHYHPPDKPVAGIEFVNQPVSAFAKRLRAQAGKHIWIMGGSGLIASFLDAGEIDELIVNVIPTFIGEGIPLIHPKRRSVELALLGSRRFADGVLRLHYRVKTSDTMPG